MNTLQNRPPRYAGAVENGLNVARTATLIVEQHMPSAIGDTGGMISTEWAARLRELGLEWHPAPGDAFCIDSGEFDSEVFTVSEMAVEAHEFDTGTILGFNGTTEWALDSVALEDALWLPREAQLRELLGDSFESLHHDDDGYRVHTVLQGEGGAFTEVRASDAYAHALCALLEAVRC